MLETLFEKKLELEESAYELCRQTYSHRDNTLQYENRKYTQWNEWNKSMIATCSYGRLFGRSGIYNGWLIPLQTTQCWKTGQFNLPRHQLTQQTMDCGRRSYCLSPLTWVIIHVVVVPKIISSLTDKALQLAQYVSRSMSSEKSHLPCPPSSPCQSFRQQEPFPNEVIFSIQWQKNAGTQLRHQSFQ